VRAYLAFLFVACLSACATPYVQSSAAPTEYPSILVASGAHTVVTADGVELPLRICGPADPHAVVVGVHGFNDYSMTFGDAGRWWAQRGIATYAYDQRGFGAAPEPGRWPGQATLVRDLEDVVRAVADRHPAVPVFLHGNSMGGAVVLVALATRADEGPLSRVAGASLTAPAVWGGSAMSPFYRASLWLAAHTVPSRHVTGRGLGILPSDNIEMLRALGRDPLVIKRTRIDSVYGLVALMGEGQQRAREVSKPLLVLYGAKDGIIPRDPTARMVAELNENSRVAVYPDGYHMLLRDLQAEVVWRDVASWIEDPAAALPSGAETTRHSPFANLPR